MKREVVLIAMVLATTRPSFSDEVVELKGPIGSVVASQPETWGAYWGQHPKQEKITRPTRWVYHRGPEQVWSRTGAPAFKSFCAFGHWSQKTGFTEGAQFLGALGGIATPILLPMVKR